MWTCKNVPTKTKYLSKYYILPHKKMSTRVVISGTHTVRAPVPCSVTSFNLSFRTVVTSTAEHHKDTKPAAESKVMLSPVWFNCDTYAPPLASLDAESSQWNQPLDECRYGGATMNRRDSRDLKALAFDSLGRSCSLVFTLSHQTGKDPGV